MVQEFADALFDDPDLQPGDIVGPVKTQFGWHVISFTDRRPPLAERAAAVETALEAPDADFAAIARELSDGPEASAGGDLGWQTLDEVDSATLDAISGLAAGEHSAGLATDRGIVFVDKLDEATRPLDEQQRARVEATAFAQWYAEQRLAAEDDGRISQDVAVPLPAQG
jgi:parvulin-like peptidyl-prolyl isomerase